MDAPVRSRHPARLENMPLMSFAESPAEQEEHHQLPPLEIISPDCRPPQAEIDQQDSPPVSYHYTFLLLSHCSDITHSDALRGVLGWDASHRPPGALAYNLEYHDCLERRISRFGLRIPPLATTRNLATARGPFLPPTYSVSARVSAYFFTASHSFTHEDSIVVELASGPVVCSCAILVLVDICL